MPTKYLAAIQRISLGVVSLTTLLVFIIGLFVFLPMFTSNPYEEFTPRKNELRKPASVVTIHSDLSGLKAKDLKMTTLDLECISAGSHKEIRSSSSQIRLLGKWCKSKGQWPTQIVNRTNGYEATIFDLKKNKFSSDYISLVKGENRILVQRVDKEGKGLLAEYAIYLE